MSWSHHWCDMMMVMVMEVACCQSQWCSNVRILLLYRNQASVIHLCCCCCPTELRTIRNEALLWRPRISTIVNPSPATVSDIANLLNCIFDNCESKSLPFCKGKKYTGQESISDSHRRGEVNLSTISAFRSLGKKEKQACGSKLEHWVRRGKID